MDGLILETDGTKADLDRRLAPEKATPAEESLTEGIMAPNFVPPIAQGGEGFLKPLLVVESRWLLVLESRRLCDDGFEGRGGGADIRRRRERGESWIKPRNLRRGTRRSQEEEGIEIGRAHV